LDDSQVYHLLHGRGFFHDDFADDADMRQAWEECGDELTEEFIDEYPGHRPFAWWLFEGVPKYGERPIIPGWLGDRPEVAKRSREQTHGVLHTGWNYPGHENQEPEWEFLHRHGVIDDDEYAEARAYWADVFAQLGAG